MKRDELTSRIWRTVVFSGAMLGAPLVGAQPAKNKPAETKPVKPADTYDSVMKELDANTVALLAAIDELVAKHEPGTHDHLSAANQISPLRHVRMRIENRLAKLPKPATPTTSVAKLQKQLADHDVKLFTQAGAFTDSADAAGEKVVVAKLAALRKERTKLEASLKDEQAKLARPRATKEDRPLGRGFILS